jgi:hypothetical protein
MPSNAAAGSSQGGATAYVEQRTQPSLESTNATINRHNHPPAVSVFMASVADLTHWPGSTASPQAPTLLLASDCEVWSTRVPWICKALTPPAMTPNRRRASTTFAAIAAEESLACTGVSLMPDRHSRARKNHSDSCRYRWSASDVLPSEAMVSRARRRHS